MKSRRSYFLVSSVVVGIISDHAVVISIFAEDFGLGSSTFEMSELLAPVEMAAGTGHPAADRSGPHNPASFPTGKYGTVNEPPRPSQLRPRRPEAPWPRPEGAFTLEKTIRLGSAAGGTRPAPSRNARAGRQCPGCRGHEDRSAAGKGHPRSFKSRPPNRSAWSTDVRRYLPKPNYSAAAIAINAQGKVEVQVTIDENGRVISANAVGGHPVLRGPAEQAARSARFSPTLLSNVPVKVTGVIVYNFQRNIGK